LNTMATASTTPNIEAPETSLAKPTEAAATAIAEGKEAEQTSTAPTENVAEPTNQNEAELLVEGRKLLKAKDYDRACNVLSDALRLTQEKGIATTMESVDYYVAYGEALLRFVQSCNDLFGDPIRETQRQHAEAQGECNGHSKEENDDDADAGPAPENASGGDVDTSDDREIAWETFECARSIMKEYLSSDEHSADEAVILKLSTVHAFLGEICLEDERHDAALEEFTAALALQERCSEGVVSCRERATNHYWACLAAQCGGKMDTALTHCTTALDTLSGKIQDLCRGFENETECKDHSEVIEVADAVVAAMDSAAADSAEGAELKALVGVMAELKETENEVQRLILKAQEPAENATNSNGAAPAAEEEMDPLSAMINGLIQQCGIDQDELAKMEQMEQEQDSGHKQKQPQPVTTIGFGDSAAADDDGAVVHELNVVKKRRKRKMDEAGICDDDEAVAEVKKMKLSATGGAKADDAQTAGDAAE